MSIKTIYIIDDEQQTANMLGEFVQLMGYKANIYTRASQFFEGNCPLAEDSIIILDLNMPEMDGVEVMRQLAEAGYTLSLILVSGYDSGVLHSAEQLARAHSLDIIATLSKPLQYKVLQKVVQGYIQQNRGKAAGIRSNELQLTACDLEDAILNDQLVLHYQPKIDIRSGSLSGVEALVRWQHPRHGLIYPNLFIPLAEANGLIGDLTAQVISRAVQQVLFWKAEKLIIQVSVNISADNVTSLTLPEQLSNMLNNHKLDPSMLTLEVTESVLMGKLVTSLDILTRLRMKGVELSIDDFGTGYSSLSQLYRVPFTELKIDQSFVMSMVHDDEARGIVKTCIMLGHELNMNVVAEGVENIETLSLLKQMGCDIAQGYYIARPMPAGDLIDWNKSRSQCLTA
jgi:EAL domain-containing protein (putative c-di-GMP-specific phosphodiesterase class I)/CheY-like chemotaxis protein